MWLKTTENYENHAHSNAKQHRSTRTGKRERISTSGVREERKAVGGHKEELLQCNILVIATNNRRSAEHRSTDNCHTNDERPAVVPFGNHSSLLLVVKRQNE